MDHAVGENKPRNIHQMSRVTSVLCRKSPRQTKNTSVASSLEEEKEPSLQTLWEFQKYPQYCWEFHDPLWEALSGTISGKRAVPGQERILEMLWKPQMPWIIGLGGSQPYARDEFQETSWERFQGLSGVFLEFETVKKILQDDPGKIHQNFYNKHPQHISADWPDQQKASN